MSDEKRRRFRVPGRLPLPPRKLADAATQTAFEAAADRPTDPEAHTRDADPDIQEDQPTFSQVEPAGAMAASWLTIAFFAVSVCGSLLFCIGYFVFPLHANYGLDQNLVEGTGLGLTMAGLCLGMLTLAKTSSASVLAVQDRDPHHAPEEDEIAAERGVLDGFRETTLAQRKVVRRALLLALGLVPVPFIVSLRSTGPRPGSLLRQSAWKAGERLVDADTKEPIRLDDLDVGGVATVMPEGATDSEKPINAESVVILIRLPYGVNQPLPGRANWSVGGLVAYSKICTHAGCPVGLYQQQDHQLLCPCHQSTFDVPKACQVIFGPAARPLPQLPIYADAEGYLRAGAPFDQPLGPSYWERNGSLPQNHE